MRILNEALSVEQELRYEARLQLPDGTDIAGEIVSLSVTSALNGSTDSLTLGAAAAATLTCTIDSPGMILLNTKVQLYIGREVDDILTEIPFGVYTITEVADNEGAVTLTGYDAMALDMEMGYFPSGNPATAKAVLADLCAQAGVGLVVPVDVVDVAVSVTSGSTRREMISYMAALLGCSACMDDMGRLALRWFTTSGLTVDCDTIYSGGLSLADRDWALEKIECSVTPETTDEDGIAGEDTQTLTAGTGTTGISISNPFMTQSILDGIYERIEGLIYRSGTVSFLGDLRHEVGDIVTVVDYNGVAHAVPIMQLTLEYDGGLKMTIEAYTKSEAEESINTGGPLSRAVERYAAELGLFKTLMADNITATNAKIGTLMATDAQLQNAIIGKADIADLSATNALILQLQAVDAELQNAIIGKANITDLNATNANLGNVTADLAAINNLLAGNAGVGNLQAIHLTNANAVIDDAIITDAMIASLTASKLTAGTIYTDLIKIMSQSGALLMDGETIQINDGTRVRVQIGKDAAGDYNLALWGANGALLWDASGVYAAGLHNGIIRDIAIADDANINQSKIDMPSVAQRLNEDGSITVDASKVLIDDTTLAVAYKAVTTSVTAAQTTANSALTAATAAQESIDNLQVGGRNLLRYTKEVTGHTTYVSGTSTNAYEIDSEGFCVTTIQATGAYNSLGFYLPDIPIEDIEGKQVVISMWVKSDGLATAPSGYQLSAGVFTSANARRRYKGLGNFNSTASNYNVQDYVDGEWVRLVCKATLPLVSAMIVSSATEDYVKYGLQIYVNISNTQYPLQVKKVKMELGNTATDWTPAPEDVDSAITAVTERTTTLETSLSVVQGQIAAKVWQSDITSITDPLGTQVTTLADQYATVNQTVQGIQAEVGNLSTTVGNNYTSLDSKIATLSLTADGLQTQVTSVQSTANNAVTAAANAQTSASAAQAAADAAQDSIDNLSIGGTQILRGTNTPDELLSLATWAQGRWRAAAAGVGMREIVAINDAPNANIKHGWHLTKTSGNDVVAVAQNAVPMTVGQTYTMSMWVRGAGRIRLSYGNVYYYYPVASDDWTHIVWTFEVSAASTVTDGGYNVLIGVVDIGDDQTICGAKLERGNTVTDWTPAPEDVDSAITATQTLIDQTSTSILQQVSATYATQDSLTTTKAALELSISQKVGTDELISAINASADIISLTSNRLVIDSTYFKLAADGTTTATNLHITGDSTFEGMLNGATGSFSGKITTTSGVIGGWTIGNAKIYGGNAATGVALMQMPTSTTTHVFAAGGTSHDNYSDCPFRVTKAGKLYATDAEIAGKITATSGSVGGFTIGTFAIRKILNISDVQYDFCFQGADGSTTSNVFFVRTSDDDGDTWEYPFRVNYQGNVWAKNLTCATISGGSEFTGTVEINDASINKGRLLSCELYGTTYLGAESEGSLIRVSYNSTGNDVIMRPDTTGGACRIGTGDYPFNYVRTKYLFVNGSSVTSDRKVKNHVATLSDGSTTKKVVETVQQSLAGLMSTLTADATNVDTDVMIPEDISEELIYGLQPSVYGFKDASTLDDKLHFGFYAQDVYELLKDLCPNLDFGVATAEIMGTGDDDTPYDPKNGVRDDSELRWSLSYTELIAPLVAVVQKQKKQLEDVKSRLAALERA